MIPPNPMQNLSKDNGDISQKYGGPMEWQGISWYKGLIMVNFGGFFFYELNITDLIYMLFY
jgi:hypothetical protein